MRLWARQIRRPPQAPPPDTTDIGAGATGAALPIPAGAVNVTPATLVDAINNNLAGTNFALGAGTYNLNAIPNKAGNGYYGDPNDHTAVVFDGQATYSSLTQDNDGTLVTGGLYYIATMEDDNVWANMTVRRYRGDNDGNGNGPWVVGSGADRWLVQNCELKDMQHSGFRGGGTGTVRYCTIKDNGRYCLAGSTGPWIVEYCNLWSSGVQGLPHVPRVSDSNRGISKFNHSNGIEVRFCDIGNITGYTNGLWWDGNNRNYSAHDNHFHDISRHGFISELGWNGSVVNNTFYRCGLNLETQAYRHAAIFSHNGGTCIIDGNVVESDPNDPSANGIIIYQSSRNNFGVNWDTVCGSEIRNNTVIGPYQTSWIGYQISATYGDGCDPIADPADLIIQNNDEQGSGISHWRNGSLTPSEWAALGYS